MRVRDLAKMSGSTKVSVWPPAWSSAYKGAAKFATGDEGVLEAVERHEDFLSLTMRYEDRAHLGHLTWDEPPTMDDVEAVLKEHIGVPIKDIGAKEIPEP
jgi:hypothetical protein